MLSNAIHLVWCPDFLNHAVGLYLIILSSRHWEYIYLNLYWFNYHPYIFPTLFEYFMWKNIVKNLLQNFIIFLHSWKCPGGKYSWELSGAGYCRVGSVRCGKLPGGKWFSTENGQNLWFLFFCLKLIYRWCQMTSHNGLVLGYLDQIWPFKNKINFNKNGKIYMILFILFCFSWKVSFSIFHMMLMTPILQLQQIKMTNLKSS